MFDLSALFKRAGQVAAENSPAILTAIGVTGTLTTAYLAAKGALSAAEALKEAEAEKQEKFGGEGFQEGDADLTTQEKIEATWQYLAPAAASAAMTVVAIICSNRISDRRTAALASAYSVVKESYTEYQKKTIEKVGPKKAQDIKDDVAAEMIKRHPVKKTEFIMTNIGSNVFFDRWSGRYFSSDVESVRKAVNDFNQMLIHDTYASLNDFWDLAGLPTTVGGSYLGWSTDNLLAIDISWVTIDGERVAHVDFQVPPIAKYDSNF